MCYGHYLVVMCNIPKIYQHFNNFMYIVVGSISISKFKIVNNIVTSINIGKPAHY